MRVLKPELVIVGAVSVAVLLAAYYYYATINGIDNELTQVLSNVPILKSGPAQPADDDDTGEALGWLGSWVNS